MTLHLVRFIGAMTIPAAAFAGAILIIIVHPALDDPDYYWHVEAGRYIVENLTLPDTDIFSFTASDHRWVPHEWLFQVLLYLVHSVAGTLGVKILTAGLGAGALAVVYTAARRLLGGSAIALLLMAGVFVGILPGMNPRPQLVTYLFFAAFVSALVEFKYLGSMRRLWLLPVLMVVWVNSHGGYAIGLLLVFVFIAAERLSMSLNRQATAEKRRLLGQLALVGVACVLASLCNPDFANHWLYPLAVVKMKATTMIREWAPLDFRTRYGLFFYLIVGCYALVYMYRRTPPDLTEVLLPGMLIALSLQSQRNVPFALFAVTLFVAAGLFRDPASSPIRISNESLGRFARSIGKLNAYSPAIAWLLSVLMLSAAIITYPTWRSGEQAIIRSRYPVGAADFVLQAGVTGRLFNEYDHGGYLIHRLRPQKVFIDGRADVYGDRLVFEWYRVTHGEPDWSRLFNSYQIDYVIIRRRTPLRQLLLEGDEYVLVYDDQTTSVLVRDSERYAEITEKYRIEPPDH